MRPVKYHYFDRYFAYSVERRSDVCNARLLDLTRAASAAAILRRRHCQVGSLAGAVHLSNDNAGVLR